MSPQLQTGRTDISLDGLRERMIREVEIFLEGGIARGTAGRPRPIPTRPSAAPPAPAAAGAAAAGRPAPRWASWYHGRAARRLPAAGETGPC